MTYKTFLKKLEKLCLVSTIAAKSKEEKESLKEIAKLIIMFRMVKEK